MNRKTIDSATLALWHAVAAVAAFAARLAAAALGLLYSLATRLLDAVPKHRRGAIWQVLDKLASIPADIAESRLATEATDIATSTAERFSNAMERSGGLRLAALALAFTAALMYAHPPSHWGPWRLYQKGVASYYDKGFAGKKTASGETYDPGDLTAAHRTLPLGILVKVERRKTGKTVYVRINDRGPYAKDRVIDLSRAAARRLGIQKKGTAEVAIYIR